jgi:hypothetical protein
MATTSLTNTNISDTYTGVLHAKGEPIPASGLQDVYDGFGNKSSLKIGRAGQGIDIDGSLGASFINALYPVGAVIFSADDTNPGVRFTGTTWTQVAEGRFIAGVGTGNDGTESVAIAAGNDSTGKYNTTLTIAQIPAHSHMIFKNTQSPLQYRFDEQPYVAREVTYYNKSQYRIETTPLSPDFGATSDAGSGDPHTNLPPTFGMYMWKRTS